MKALYERMEREYPGILDEIERVKAAMKAYVVPKRLDPWFAKMDAPWAHLVTQRMIDCVHLAGKPEDICEGVERYAQVGVTGIATSVSTIIDKKEMMRTIGSEVILRFCNRRRKVASQTLSSP